MGAGPDRVDDATVELSREIYRLFRAGDAAFFELLDPDIRWYVSDTIPGGGDLRGVSEAIGFLESMSELFEDAAPDPEEFIPAGDKLLVLGTFRGRARATGNEVEAPFAHVGEFRDGRLVSFRNYLDTARLLRALDEPGGV